MATAKSEAPTAPAKGEAAAAPAAPAAAPVPTGGGLSAWLPVIAAVVLSPVVTWVMVEFVLLPQMQKKLSAPPAAEAAKSSSAPEGGKESGAPGYEFSNVVVNLSGTMGTRYLKTSFLVTGPDADLKSVFEGAKPRLTDVTLNVLSSLTLADLEEPGSKNVIRERLVGAYNQAIGRKVADQVYFSDFVIQ
jgi:flagellar FliL protein